MNYLKLDSEQCMDSTQCPYLFGFKFVNSDNGEDYIIDPTYFDVKVHSTKAVWDYTAHSYVKTKTDILVVPCSN